ncbi:hypothetical protein K2173_016742 [Erythroxylum novogranatense]|uniref:PHD-type domain-containing protein n=1 Tax=Erythroxylum novogranatense TaxID=1862640 RepID=A0AAV8SSW0_9ROSI|nr:hypothetical protein K2173_016742 [Erythroxylum novogranatense]
MQVKSASVSSPKQRDFTPTGSRLRKKHKRLDAISESVYNQNHNDSNLNRGRSGSQTAEIGDFEPRRSSRVRRAPVVLDVSPPPVKRRRKFSKNSPFSVKQSQRISVARVEEEVKTERIGVSDVSESWRHRLRSRDRNAASEEKGKVNGKRKLLYGVEISAELDFNKGELMDEKLMLGRSKRLGRSKVVRDSETGEQGSGIHDVEKVSKQDDGQICFGKHEIEKVETKVVANDGQENAPVLHGEVSGGNDGELLVADPLQLGAYERHEKPVLHGEVSGGNDGELLVADPLQLGAYERHEKVRVDAMELEKEIHFVENLEQTVNEVDDKLEINGNGEDVERSDNKEEDLTNVKNQKCESHSVEVVEDLKAVVDESGNKVEGALAVVSEMPLENREVKKVDKSNGNTTVALCRPRIKHGRRCGLCGCGDDGKPPKKLMQDAGDSENEAYSGSSASEETEYDIWDGFGDEPGWLGRLLGPINDRYGIAGIWVHQHCAVWSPEVYFAGLGCLRNVRAALCRGKALKCSRCGRPGATIGCRVDRCPKTYHLPCARANGCIFDHQKFLIACTDHKHHFQPHDDRYLMRVKKLEAKKMQLELRKLSNDAWRKDVEAEEKWLENCGEDEEFLKRESKRLHRDLLRIAPVYIGGSDSENGKLCEGWESVAGLKDVIRCMKEVVILPLLYPEFFNNLGIAPPRGVLLHGYPGTGKTLVVRALIGSCARGDKRIAYFARKGADCLGKYVGDAERQLRLLFQVAERCQPSIIFFDEIDGLAPCRTRQQDQTHISVVSTLLALMDGLKSRGSVVVIGATNRPEAVDPALRRPGRFDREIYFPLPSSEDRAAILSLHTQRWPKPVNGLLLNWIARRTVGFAGADLQALCTQAAIIALKRNFPLQEVLSAAGEEASGRKRLPLPAFTVEEKDWLEALACAPPPCSCREAGIAAHALVSYPLPSHLIPCFLEPLSTLLVALYVDDSLWMPPSLLKAAITIKTVIVSSLEQKNLASDRWWSYIGCFLKEDNVAKEILRRLSRVGMLIAEGTCAGIDAVSEDNVDDEFESQQFAAPIGGIHRSLSSSVSFSPRKKSEYRLLIAGSARSGQKHLASCILHSFVGNVEIQKIDLATICEEGHGDMEQGITEILMKCASLQSCLIFMPRIDLWALETCCGGSEEDEVSPINPPLLDAKTCCVSGQVVDGLNRSSVPQYRVAETIEHQDARRRSSHVWNSFVEQVESISVSTSLIILATSEFPYQDLPCTIRLFFEAETPNTNHSSPMGHAISRFCVNVDRTFDHDSVINLSALELSRDMVQLFVQLVHQRAHAHRSSPQECKIGDPFQDRFDTKSTNDIQDAITESPCRTLFEAPSPLNSKNSKGKSSLLLAICNFGYQILRYPHFAELCWVTSKLKEGPCTDISGPWKGWPFNSCIIRPSNSLDQMAVAGSSSNMKIKDRSDLVRGLIAVGLSAYRGIYKSLRDVSCEVRKVLELLVGEIMQKIQSGKDRYQYVRLLSQVAYLEDMVNSWVYALQSLELDAQTKMANHKPSGVEYPTDGTCLGKNSFQSEEHDRNAYNGATYVSEGPEGIVPQNLEAVESYKAENAYNHNSERTAHSKNDFAEQSNLCDQTNLHKHLKCWMVDDQSRTNITNGKSETALGWHDMPSTMDLKDTNEASGSLRESTVCFRESFVSSENGLCDSDLSASKFNPERSCIKVNKLESRTNHASNESEEEVGIHDGNFSTKTITVPCHDAGLICIYACCPICLYTLHNIIRKIFIGEMKLNRCHWTAEDFHDIHASLSVALLSAVRKVEAPENITDFSDGVLVHETPSQMSEILQLHGCQCKSSGNSLGVNTECDCHSADGCLSGKAKDFLDSQLGLDTKFVFRDGVLVTMDSNKAFSSHCKYENLCLCPLIESIVMMKQPTE